MKLLYLINLFIVCSTSFIIRGPSYLPIKFNPSNISIDVKNKINYNNKFEYLLRKSLININLKKNNNNNNNNNNNDNNDDNNYDDDNKKYEIKLLINFIYNIILYSYIFSHS